MKPKNIKTLLALFLLVSFASCFKKGKDDPFISLRTRKARVVGKWKMVKGTKILSSSNFTTLTTFTEDQFEITYVQPNSSYVAGTGTVNFTINCSKNGKSNFHKDLGTSGNYFLEGNWNFTGGIGKIKKKEQIVFSGYVSQNDLIFDIKELRNKKMVLIREDRQNTSVYSEEFEFIQ